MGLQAHYRSELEFSWEGLGAALTRLKRLVMAVERLKASTGNERTEFEALNDFDKAICDDLTSPKALTFLANVVTGKRYEPDRKSTGLNSSHSCASRITSSA